MTDKENIQWYTKSELEEMYWSALLSDNLPAGLSFDEYLALVER